MENTTTLHIWRLVLLLCAICLNNHVVILVSARDAPSAKQDLITNKSPIIKTLKFKEGDIVDCYDINKQPALDHPLLKNHKVQVRPRSIPDELTKFLLEPRKQSIFSKREVCPSGTVPIPRSRKDVSNSSFSTDIAYIGHHIPGQQRVFVYMNTPSDPAYNGVVGSMSVHNVSLTTTSQSSGTFVMIHNGPPEEMNLISAGWMVSPRINGDAIPRLYIYWTRDGYKTSCYNNNGCGGFVQTNQYTYPTYPMQPASTPEVQFGSQFLIFKDRISGDWWLVVNNAAHSVVGYWPKELLPHLVDGANMVAWGGIVFAGDDRQSPPMGSGHFPRNDFIQNSVFTNISYVDETHALKTPPENQTGFFGGTSGCYRLSNDGYRKDINLGYIFQYGGHGGDCGI